jgi:hypothetical protein
MHEYMNPVNNGAGNPEEARLRVDPGADRRLEDLHHRADDMVDHDDFRLIQRLQARPEQHDLDGDHAEKQEVVARQWRGCGIVAVGRDHQRNRDAAEQAGPALLDAEAKEFIEYRRRWAACHEAPEALFADDETAKRRPGGGGTRRH